MAASPRRRWVVISDLVPNLTLRAFYSDHYGPWVEIPAVGLGNDGVSISAIDDTTALVAWAGLSKGSRWGYIRGDQWVLGLEDGSFPLITTNSARVRLRRNPAGDHWLAVSPYGVETLLMTRFTGDEWTTPIALNCAYPGDPNNFFTNSPAMSRDANPLPVVAWGWQNTQAQLGICVCIPDENGYPVATNFNDPLGAGVAASVAVDRNNDVWLAWWSFYGTSRWTHTYVIATAVDVVVAGNTEARTVTWTLSEPAPRSRWAVLRRIGTGAEEVAAIVEAGTALDMAWTDQDHVVDVVRYRVRRESVNLRYEWLSAEALFEYPVATLLSLVSAEADAQSVRLRWQGPGAAALEARVERRAEAGAWEALGAAAAAGPDDLVFEDDSVIHGTRYAYRLVWTEGGEDHVSAESWVDVPLAPRFALEGFAPNPASRGALVAFTLPRAARGRLEVIDVAGRRVFRRDLAGLGAGRHTIAIDSSRSLRAGVYLIRLTHDDRSLHARGVITR
jgi:hypothetical protein